MAQTPLTTSRKTVWKLAATFLIALVLLYLLGAVIGWEETLEQMRRAHLGWVGVACLSTLLCLLAWAKTWHAVLGSLGVSVPFHKLVVTFYAGAFANYVTPMGQAGGEPFVAYVLSQDTQATYEQSLASVVTTDLLRLLPFFTVGTIGAGYLLVTAGLTRTTEQFVLLLGALGVAVPIAVAVGWYYRIRVRGGVLRILAPIVTRTDRIDIDSVADRIDKLYVAVERIATSPRALAISIVFAYVGYVFFALPLYAAGIALSVPLSILFVCFAVPATTLAGSTPLPGGLGAIEASLVVFLTLLVGTTTADALAVTTVYRLASYWLVIAVGGLAAVRVVFRV